MLWLTFSKLRTDEEIEMSRSKLDYSTTTCDFPCEAQLRDYLSYLLDRPRNEASKYFNFQVMLYGANVTPFFIEQ